MALRADVLDDLREKASRTKYVWSTSTLAMHGTQIRLISDDATSGGFHGRKPWQWHFFSQHESHPLRPTCWATPCPCSNRMSQTSVFDHLHVQQPYQEGPHLLHVHHALSRHVRFQTLIKQVALRLLLQQVAHDQQIEWWALDLCVLFAKDSCRHQMHVVSAAGAVAADFVGTSDNAAFSFLLLGAAVALCFVHVVGRGAFNEARTASCARSNKTCCFR